MIVRFSSAQLAANAVLSLPEFVLPIPRPTGWRPKLAALRKKADSRNALPCAATNEDK